MLYQNLVKFILQLIVCKTVIDNSVYNEILYLKSVERYTCNQ